MAILLILAFITGYSLALWQYRYEKLRNLALRVEIIAMRNRVQPVNGTRKPPAKKKNSKRVPRMPWWGKAFLGFLWCLIPEAIKYNQFHSKTLKNWAQTMSRPSTYIYLLKNWANRQKGFKDKINQKRGRPTVEQYLVDIILCIKKESPGYSPGFIARILYSQLREYIDKKTVQSILKKNGYPPNPPHKKPPLSNEPKWKAYINNQLVCAMDFKSIIDIMGNQLFILNIIHHSRRQLIYSVATHNPTSAWIAQQIREAFPFDTAPKYMIMDRDTIFLPLIHQTLPNIGIEVFRTDFKSPWQNCVVERFNLTLQQELLDYITPVNTEHMNRLLAKYKVYYNYARPHMTNNSEPPVHEAIDIQPAEKSLRNLESIPWVGGFHHSYHWAA